MSHEEFVVKRNGVKQPVSFDKILARIKAKCYDDLNVNQTQLTSKIIARLYDGIKTTQIDELTAQQCASLSTTHPDYGVLGSRILISNHQKNTDKDFALVITQLYSFRDIHNVHHPLISQELFEIVNDPYNNGKIQSWFDFDRDYLLDYFGFKTLEKAYLMKINGTIVERPQHMWMRVAFGIHGKDLEAAKQTYDLMSNKYFTHATPTLFNAGTPRPQMEGIYNTLKDCALISKWAGGIGLHMSNVRVTGSHIRGTNGTSNGIVPMLQVFNATARYCDQGGKRQGSFAIYLEPWHADVESFLDMKKNHGDEDQRARDLFYALWIPDLFMKRVKDDQVWTLMCPDRCPGLSDVYGDKFEELYTKYEKEKRGLKTVKARDIWFKILDSQIETGNPYMLYKNACNSKSNQKNLGTIKSSNLCCVHGKTLLLTDKGHQIIETLKDEKVNVWNGKEFSEVVVKQTNDKAELLTIAFSDGSELTCTKYHKFYIQTKIPFKMKQDIIKSKSVQLVEAQDLKPDMKLIKCEYPIIDNKIELKSAYTNGIFSADGTYTNISEKEERKCNFKSLKGKSFCKRHINYQKKDEISEYCCGISYTKKAHISLYDEKIKLLEYLDYRSVGEEKNNRLNVTLPVYLKDKFFVPTNYSLKSKLDWFTGYCDGDGSIARNGTNQSLQISCIHKEFLLKIKLILQTCGIASKVTLNMNERLSNLPDGKGGMAYYKSKKLWRLLIGSNDLQKLLDLGFSPKRLIINKHTPQRNDTQFVKISKITDNGEIDKTFCFTEKKRHAGIFNGVITSQCEIIQYSDSKETACCNLASIALPRFVKYTMPSEEKTITIHTKNNCKWCSRTKSFFKKRNIEYKEINYTNENIERFILEHKTLPQIFIGDYKLGGYTELKNCSIFKSYYDYKLLHEITKVITYNLNKVIDRNFYPTEKTKKSNFRHRPIGIGVQGLADTFALMDVPFYSHEAKIINEQIFETIYHAALEASWELACKDGSYETFQGSPASKGILQFDMWDISPTRYDWGSLKKKIITNGIRNSLLVAPMPTASTSQILGFNECFEPFTNNIYVRRTSAGEFVVVNKYLLEELINLDLWTDEIKNKIIGNNGSIQDIDTIPSYIKEKYKIVWEIPMKHILEMCADRGAFICQSQSTNLWMKDPNYNKLNAMHFFAWKKGLKTGIYYLRTKAKAAPQQFTIEPDKKTTENEEEEEDCLMCGS
ncbi:MAG: hypothetical protein CXT73_04435 [Methanobacteriota archaeon]|nr:MAG: hypothetical protein CXT73_04435 [Euryarchaeota archaeon]